MSSIHTYPSHVSDFMSHADRNPEGRLEPDHKAASHTDDGMMFPWSIGTTAAAKERPVVRRKEECPPETYIG